MLAYLPQLATKFEPLKSYLNRSEPYTIIKMPLSASVMILIFITVGVSIRSFALSYQAGDKNVKQLLIFFISLVMLGLLVYIRLNGEDGYIVIEFLPKLVPLLLSTTIGIIGSFIVTCITVSNYIDKPKFQRQKVLHPLISQPVFDD